MTSRYLFEVNLGVEDKPKMLLVLAHCIKMAKDLGVALTILTPMIKDFRGSFFGDAIGDATARDLVNKKDVKIADVPIRLVAATTITTHAERGVILGLWCSRDMLDILDQCTSAQAIVVASYNPAEVLPWAQKHGITMQSP